MGQETVIDLPDLAVDEYSTRHVDSVVGCAHRVARGQNTTSEGAGMAGNVQDLVREAIINALQGSDGSSQDASASSRSNGGLSGVKGIAAGAGAAALAPVAVKGVGRLAKGLGIDGLQDAVKSPGEALEGATSNLGDRLTSGVKDKVEGKVEEAGGPGGMLIEAAKSALPFGGGGGDSKGAAAGVGEGRRMPVQQSVDIGLPIETVYNQFTQFEEWPLFMHRVTRVTQEDECTVSFATKIWAKTKEFTAQIEEQHPEERIKWRVSQGMDHTGVVSFHELGPRLTRVLVGFDVKPGGLIEKFARGARHVKRAARGDLHRFKAFIEMAGQETGAWRGVIEDGEVVEEHDPGYDEQREYADIEELTGRQSEGDEEEEESPRSKRSQTRQRSRSGDRQKQSGSRGQRRSQASSRRGQSGGSGQTRARGGSSRRGSGGSSGGSSQSSGRGRSSQTSSRGRSGGTGRSRSQSRKR